MQSCVSLLARHPQRLQRYWLLVLCLSAACLLFIFSNGQCCTLLALGNAKVDVPPQRGLEARVAMVVATQMGDDITWLDAFPNYTKSVYVTDDPNADLAVPQNKGREGMAYLTYIIDNYDKLPKITIFSHSTRYQWHNDDPFYDGQAVLARLNLPHVQREGYVSLRCGWSLGCPAEIHPLSEANATGPVADPESKEARAGSFYKEAFEELFPHEPVPEVIGAHCCAQFAVTADKIHERPVTDYIRFRAWLLHTPLKDYLSGRILEYSWHIIFRKPPVHCPNAGDCYCKLFGLCGLQCKSAGSCDAAYTLPQYSTLPEGWPDYDWEHQWRNVTELRLKYESDNGAPRANR